MTLYTWHADNLKTATASLDSHWRGDFTAQSTKITTDTRNIKQGDIFLAIKGDNFDGHDYVQTAIDKGAVAVIVSQPQAAIIPQLIVTDTKLALGQLGKYRRDQLAHLKVVAITGSSGKTTTKEMLGAILSQIAPTLITRGNLNNDLGVPMMLLELTDQHQFAVMELGANHVGEIAYTTQLVKPDVACVLNIGTAHLGEFGGRENIAKTKAEIFQGLSEQGVAVLPLGDEFFSELQSAADKFTHNQLTFGEHETTFDKSEIDFSQFSAEDRAFIEETDTLLEMGDVFADDIEIDSDHSTFSVNFNPSVDEIDSREVILPFLGEHNVTNALSAAACALALGVNLDAIAKGLNQAKPAKGRLNKQKFSINGLEHILIDDTYNANPTSMLVSAQVLANEDGQRILVIGDIGELGDEAENEHRKLGAELAKLPLDNILAVGELMKFTSEAISEHGGAAKHFSDKTQLANYLTTLLQAQVCTVLFKGSRFMAIETVMADLVRDSKTA